ncbi:MAG: RNA 2',3'-cyclic phosphodiesterase [Paracoccaceae bacterium]
MRAFLAIPIPDDVAGRLEDIQSDLPFGRLVPAENLHLTVAFLGEQPWEALRDLHDALEAFSSPRFTVSFGPLGTFGGSAPSSLHAEVDPAAALRALHAKLRGVLHATGIATERRRFRPHVTLARFRPRMEPTDQARLARFLTAHAAAPIPSFEACALTLFRSTLRPDGAVHDALAEYPLV